MALPLWLIDYQMSHWLGESRWADMAELVIAIPIGLFIFFIALRLLKVDEATFVFQIFGGPFRQKLDDLRARIVR